MAEMVEEYTQVTKKALRTAILCVLVAHVLGWLLEDLPLSCLLVGIVAHASYLALLRSFPFIELVSLNFIGSALLLVLNHAIWFRHFTVTYYAFPEIVAYFLLFVWLVPFVFFISLSANENALPLHNTRRAYGSGDDNDNDAHSSSSSKSSSVLKAFIGRFKSATAFVTGQKSL
jgi:hypothetical protein